MRVLSARANHEAGTEVPGVADNGIGDYFIRDVEDEAVEEDDAFLATQVVVPGVGAAPAPTVDAQEPSTLAPSVLAEVAPPAVAASAAQPAPEPAPAEEPTPLRPQALAPAPAPAPAEPIAAASAIRPQATARQTTREERLAVALDTLMAESADVQAAALVSLDGFTMASALPPGMQEDRVGAMSAAILALGERAATELGRGRLSQVFIEGADGYVLLMASGSRSVLTALAGRDAKLGLVLYDMRHAAEAIGEIVG